MSLQTLAKKLRKRFPNVVLEFDESACALGKSYLDVRLDGHSLVVEWQNDRGFGVSARPDIGFGERPDEVFKSEVEAFQRVAALLLSQTKTSAPPEIRLRELREEAGLSQIELANLMSIQQATISKIEQGRDVRVSTLKSLVAALGAELSIAARFPDGREQPLDLSALRGEK